MSDDNDWLRTVFVLYWLLMELYDFAIILLNNNTLVPYEYASISLVVIEAVFSSGSTSVGNPLQHS